MVSMCPPNHHLDYTEPLCRVYPRVCIAEFGDTLTTSKREGLCCSLVPTKSKDLVSGQCATVSPLSWSLLFDASYDT